MPQLNSLKLNFSLQVIAGARLDKVVMGIPSLGLDKISYFLYTASEYQDQQQTLLKSGIALLFRCFNNFGRSSIECDYGIQSPISLVSGTLKIQTTKFFVNLSPCLQREVCYSKDKLLLGVEDDRLSHRHPSQKKTG